MQTKVVNNLKKITEDRIFQEILKKVTLNIHINTSEKIYILSLAILLLKEYESNRKYTTYLDFSYYLLLKYSIISNDYKPLYDFSINFGFYPISNLIIKNNLIETNIDDLIIFSNVNNNFTHEREKYIETYEQRNNRRKFLDNIDDKEKCYIAPTSFGKSSLIVEYIKLFNPNIKIGIIVPTKSLIVQTTKIIKNNFNNIKVITHNEMYSSSDESFIGIFTQERAVKLMDENDLFFDVLIIDEAHKLLEYNDRNIFLSRLIKNNRRLNLSLNILYLTPLLSEGNLLKIDKNQTIHTYIIQFNIKEPVIYEFNETSKSIYIYNRFLDKFYNTGKYISNKISYIKQNSKNKNFIYINSPRKIDLFIKNEVSTNLNKIDSDYGDIKIFKDILKKEIHEKFYMINTIDYGLVYLHGQLPDIIKEYIEYKFKKIKELKFIIANTVILEGVNLPIDNLFIYSDRGLNNKDLINLIGRVNRLNDVFKDGNNNIEMLLPNIHFFYDKETKLGHNTKIQGIRSRVFKDTVTNPLLNSFDIDIAKMTKQKKYRDRFISDAKNIQNNEEYLMNYPDKNKDEDEVKKYFIQYGLVKYFKNFNTFIYDFISIKNKNIDIKEYTEFDNDESDEKLNNRLILFKIYFYFLSNDENISDYQLLRLIKKATRNYYTNYFTYNLKRNIKGNIISQVNYFNKRIIEGDPLFYIGSGYGDTSKPNKYTGIDNGNKVYINLKNINDEGMLVNLAITKLQIEEKFISFHLMKFIEALYYFKLIGEKEYNLFSYGTNDKSIIEYIKTGLSLPIVEKLKTDGQLNSNIEIKNGILETNESFKAYLNQLNDFQRFEIERIL